MVKHNRRQSMKMGRSMKRIGGQTGEMMPGQDPQVQPVQVQPVQVQPNGASTGNPFTNFLSDAQNKIKDVTNLAETTVGQASDTVGNKFGEVTDKISGTGTVTPPVVSGEQTPVVSGEKKEGILSSFGFGGGRRRSKSRQMQMRGGLNQSFGYNAAPVMDSVTSEPTYMIKGGKRRRRRSRRRSCKKRRGCKKSCKRHRHRR